MSFFQATLFWCVVQVSLFLTVAAPIYLAVRRRHPRAGTWAAAGSLAVVVALSGLAASPWPRWAFVERDVTAGAAASATASSDALSANTTTPIAVDGGRDAAPQLASSSEESTILANIWRAFQTASAPSIAQAGGANVAADSAWRWAAVVVAIVAVGIVANGARLIAGLFAVRRLVQTSRPLVASELNASELIAELNAIRRRFGVVAPVELRESAAIATPATVGWRRPTILLPAAWPTWSAAERRAVLAHELAHIAQHDFAAWLVARAAIVLHFYHPLVRWFARRFLDQELAADAAAVRLLGDRDSYLRALASLALATPAHRLPSHVQTFIPSRSLLVRRVEMLRTAEVALVRSSRFVRAARAACLGSLIVVAALVAGIRPPAAALQAEETPAIAVGAEGERVEETGAESKATPEGYDFSYVPDDALFVIAMRPDQIAASPQLKPLADLAESTMRPLIPFASLSQLTMAVPRPLRDDRGLMITGSGAEYTLFRTNQPIDFRKALTESYGPIKDVNYRGRQLMTQNSGGSITFYSPNERTLISNSPRGLEGVIDDTQAAAGPKNVSEWSGALTGPIFAVGNPEAMRQMMAPQSIVNQLFRQVIDAAEQLTLATEDGETFVIRAKIVCREAEDVPRVEQTLQSIVLLARNAVDSMTALGGNGPGSNGSVAGREPLFRFAKEALDSLEFKADGATLTITAKIKDAKSAITDVLIPQFKQAELASRRSQSLNNLKYLALAALSYASIAEHAFPPSVVYGKSAFPQLNSSGDKSAHVPRSWRVELLPLLEHEELYKQYRLDQPWDSEANLKVLKQMPAVYRSPFDEPSSTNTSYYAVTGPGTVFDGEEGTPLRAITDGTSHTLLWVEANREIPWTKPEDIAYEPGKEVPKLGGWMENGEVPVAYCDGSIHMLVDVAEAELRELIGKADGDDVEPFGRQDK